MSDFSSLTNQIDWATAIAAILLIAGGLAGLYVVDKGVELILARLNGFDSYEEFRDWKDCGESDYLANCSDDEYDEYQREKRWYQ